MIPMPGHPISTEQIDNEIDKVITKLDARIGTLNPDEPEYIYAFRIRAILQAVKKLVQATCEEGAPAPGYDCMRAFNTGTST
jgi:hypothetical protein